MSEQNTNVVARDQRRRELEATSFSAGSQGGALMQPKNGRELMDMANMMSASGQMIRDFYRGNPGDCAALIMICQPYGFNPFMVSWKTYKASSNANAPISFEGQLVNAMVNMSAPVRGRLRYTYQGEGQDRTCTVVGIDRETGEEITYTSPPVKSIPVKNSPLWKADPDQQLGYFSARAWARRHFPELLLGVYTREEIEEAPRGPRDITPADRPMTPLQRKAAEARGQVAPETHEEATPEPDVPDAEEVTPEPEVPPQAASHWTDEVDMDATFPGSAAWTEGVKAAQAGMKRTMCPHEEDHGLAADWLAGFDGARRAGE